MKIEVICPRCLGKNEQAERLIERLRAEIERKTEHYEMFKQVAALELKRRKGFLEWLLG